MALEHVPDAAADEDVVEAEVVELGRLDRLKEKTRPHVGRARTTYDRQRAIVARRVGEWFAVADYTDERLAEQVEARRRRAAKQKEAQLQARARQLRAQVKNADAGSASTAGLEVQLLRAEVALQDTASEDVGKVGADELVKARWQKKLERGGMTALGGMVWLGGLGADPLVALASLGALPVGWWWLARPYGTDENAVQEQKRPSVSLVKQPGPPAAESMAAGAAEVPADSPYGPELSEPEFDAPPPPALSEQVLTTALRDCRAIKSDETVTVLAAPPFGSDGTATIVADLPAGTTVAAVKKKQEALAGALGRDVSMIDIGKAGAAGRMSLWLCDSDPFEPPRPSPLLKTSGGIDAWRDGVPVAWAKRGNAVCLPVKNSSFLIGGMTRSGKGVGAANLAVGAALDTRINLRIVAGKNNGEWDPYAKAGVAATYFKPDPYRLLALVQALLADKDRREADLGKLGKSKLVPDVITEVGGIELLLIDELATFTRPGKPLRDEILAGLIEISAVAAGAGILLGLITQYPEADVIPQGLAMNCGTRWAMRVDNATQSNAILGGGQASTGRDASKFDPPLPGLGWLVNPFAGVTDLARSFDLDEDEREEVTALMHRSANLRSTAGRLAGQWDDPIEQRLVERTGLSSAAGGPDRNGIPARALLSLSAEQKAAYDATAAALEVMDALGRDAQLEEMAARIGDGMTGERLGELLRAAGTGGTVKVTVDGRRVNGYQRTVLRAALDRLGGT